MAPRSRLCVNWSVWGLGGQVSRGSSGTSTKHRQSRPSSMTRHVSCHSSTWSMVTWAARHFWRRSRTDSMGTRGRRMSDGTYSGTYWSAPRRASLDIWGRLVRWSSSLQLSMRHIGSGWSSISMNQWVWLHALVARGWYVPLAVVGQVLCIGQYAIETCVVVSSDKVSKGLCCCSRVCFQENIIETVCSSLIPNAKNARLIRQQGQPL